MIAHVDKKILIDAFRDYRKDIVHNSDAFIKFLAKGADLYLYGDQSIEESNILSLFLEKREGTSIGSFDSGFATGKYSVDTGNPYQVFFLNEIDENEQDKLRDCLSSFLVGFTYDYQRKFDLLSLDKTFQLETHQNENGRITLDEILLDLPTTDIIICDRYIFDVDKDGNYSSLKSFNELLHSIKQRFEVNKLFLFIGKSGKPKDKTISEMVNVIKSEGTRVLGGNTEITTIFIDFQNEDHDRALYLNYYRIDLGSSINSLKRKDDKLIPNKRTKIVVTGYADRKCFNDSVNDLNYLSKILQATKAKIPEFPKNAGSILFNVPDKKCES